MKAIRGESTFDADMLKEMIDENHKSQIETGQEILNGKTEAERESQRVKKALAYSFILHKKRESSEFIRGLWRNYVSRVSARHSHC